MAGSGDTVKAILAWIGVGQKSAAGEVITDQSALEHLDVYACVRVISESIASLPMKMYELLDKGKQEAFDHPLYYLLSCAPNPEMTAFTFFEALTGSLALTGNCYAEIVRNAAGQAVALYPIHPNKTEPFRKPDGQIAYRTSDGMKDGQTRVIPAQNVLHVPLFSFDGLKGISPVRMAMQSIGLSKAATKYGARFFGNGSRAGGVLTAPEGMDEETVAASIQSWESTQGGENQGRTALLPGDWKYTQISLSPEESQFLATRKYQRTEMAALFRLPPYKIGDTTTQGRGNHEQAELSFVTDSLRPYLVRFEQEIIRKLLPTVGRNAGRYVVSFDVRERLRGDFQSQAQGYALGRQWGWYSINDIRTEMGENSIGPVGDVYLYPTNMGNAEQLLKQAETEPITQQPVAALPAPTDNTPPTQQERDLISSLTSTYLHCYRDAVGRVSAREHKDFGLISQVFRPLLRSIADEAGRQASLRFGLDPAWHTSLDDLVTDHLKTVHKRSAGWTAEKADETSASELRKAVRSLSINVFRDAGAHLALKGSDDGETE